MAYQLYKIKTIKLFDNLSEDLRVYKRLSLEIDTQLKTLKDIFSNIIIQIKNSNNFLESKDYFNELEVIQGYFATIIYKYNYKNDPNLFNIVRDFDRLDDIEERKYWFNFFKNNEYKVN